MKQYADSNINFWNLIEASQQPVTLYLYELFTTNVFNHTLLNEHKRKHIRFP
jgi:hypothetical protein